MVLNVHVIYSDGEFRIFHFAGLSVDTIEETINKFGVNKTAKTIWFTIENDENMTMFDFRR